MSQSSRPSRGQNSPVVGLVAAVVVTAAVGSYALVVADGGVSDRERDRRETLAATTLSRVHAVVTSGGVAVPDRLVTARTERPPGYRLHATLSAAGRTWRVGSPPPADAETATRSRRVGVALTPGRIRPGRLRVEVWK